MADTLAEQRDRLAGAIRSALTARGLTAAEAAQQMGMSPTTMAAVLHSRLTPQPKTLSKLDGFFQWQAGRSRRILAGADEPTTPVPLLTLYQAVRDFAAQCEQSGVPHTLVYGFLRDGTRMLDAARALESGGEVEPITGAELAAWSSTDVSA